jgi:hypothetical protein
VVTGSRNRRAITVLQWYALLGPPVAWSGQVVLGYFYTLSLCGPGGVDSAGLHLPIGVFSAIVAVVAAGGWASAFTLRRATSHGLEDPVGRIRFLADLGLVIGAVFLAVILYTAAGELALEGCR